MGVRDLVVAVLAAILAIATALALVTRPGALENAVEAGAVFTVLMTFYRIGRDRS